METIIINVGPLTSYNNLAYYLSPKLKIIREAYINGQSPKVIFDFSSLEYGFINISALTALLCLSKRLKEFIGKPLQATIKWDPKVQGFLADIGFFNITDKFSIYQWTPDGIIGGYKSGRLHPDTKIIYFGDVTLIEDTDLDDIGSKKAELKQKLAPNFLLRCSNLFHGFSSYQEEIISNTTLELIVNSLIHGQEFAFVGLQRTRKRITISVCDSGIGFPRSLAKIINANSDSSVTLSHAEGILIGCLIQKNIHGLRLAISEVLDYRINKYNYDDNEGWVIISSYDTEIRWQKNNWNKALNNFSIADIYNKSFKIEDILGFPVNEFIDKDEIKNGYWKKYSNRLVGTRITFEIVLND